MVDLFTQLGLAFLGNATLVWLLVWAVGSAVIGCAVASWGRMPLWVGAVVGGLASVLGLGVLLIVGAVRAASPVAPPAAAAVGAPLVFSPDTPPQAAPARWNRWSSRSGLLSLLVLVVAAGLLLAALLLDWVRVVAAGATVLGLPVWGTGLDALTITLLALVAGAAVLALRGPSRWAGVVMAVVGSTAALVGGLLAVFLLPLNRILREVARLPYNSVGEFLESVGIDPASARIPLPDWFPARLLGADTTGIDLSAIDMNAALPALSIGLGLGATLLLVSAVLALAWSCAEIVAGHRLARAGRLVAAR